MKTKILIVEECYYRYFTTKQVLEGQMRLHVSVEGADCCEDLLKRTAALEPSMLIFRPVGGVIEIMDSLKDRGINRRNAEVVIVLTTELSPEICRKMYAAAHKKPAAHIARAA